MAKDVVVKTDKERKEYLDRKNTGGICQQCPYCCADEIAEYPQDLDCYDPTLIDGEDGATLTEEH